MLGSKVDVRVLDDVVNLMPGCVITDSRNVYDKLSTEVLCMRGAEKRTDLELLSLKDAQLTNKVLVRWVHSEAQLANSLTKAREMRQLNLYYDMKQSWCIVEGLLHELSTQAKAAGHWHFYSPRQHWTTEPHTDQQHRHFAIHTAQQRNRWIPRGSLIVLFVFLVVFFLHLSERRRGHAIVMYSICHYKDSLRLLRSVLGSREKTGTSNVVRSPTGRG